MTENNINTRELLNKISFDENYFKKYDYYPEVMLLAYLLAHYFTHKEQTSQDEITVLSCLNKRDMYNYFRDILNTDPKNDVLAKYKVFKKSSENKQKDAFAALYEYYSIEKDLQ